MDMRIAGKGNVPSGEYENIKISGKGILYGTVRCVSFKSSGTSKGESIECLERFKASGSSAFTGNIKAKYIRVAGTLSCAPSEESQGENNIKCDDLSISGSLKIDGNIEAENVKIAGALKCTGLINAENIMLSADKVMNVGSIGGTNIQIKRKPISTFKRRTVVQSSIEGDNIKVKYVTCPLVTGRNVKIGRGCKIDLVQYIDTIEISRSAKIGKIEKI